MSEEIIEAPFSSLKGLAVTKLATELYQDKPLTEEELENLFRLDCAIFPSQLTVSAGETRQVRQFEPNNYHVSMQFDLSEVKTVVKKQVMQAPLEKRAEVYDDLRHMVYGVIMKKYEKGERYLRTLISGAKAADGLDKNR